jgi:predicted LPLAT superfamily acyltransferase
MSGRIDQKAETIPEPSAEVGDEASQPESRSDWAGVAERGSIGALKSIRWIYRHLGRRATIAMLSPIVVYFFVTGRGIRRASMGYLQTLWDASGGSAALDGPPTWRHVFRHIHEFAESIVDRMIVWGGDEESIEIDYSGTELLRDLARERRGGILLGSHVGSYDLLRSLAERTGVTLNILMFTPRTARINAFFERLHPGLKLHLISFEPGTLRAVFEMKAAIDRGEFVGVMGDRLWESERERSVAVTFMGRRARFPLGPFLLQAVLGCPMVLTGCFRTGAGRYRAVAVPFAPAGVVPRRERRAHAEELARRYAHTLEQWCLGSPYQWFNFFDFWPDEADA